LTDPVTAPSAEANPDAFALKLGLVMALQRSSAILLDARYRQPVDISKALIAELSQTFALQHCDLYLQQSDDLVYSNPANETISIGEGDVGRVIFSGAAETGPNQLLLPILEQDAVRGVLVVRHGEADFFGPEVIDTFRQLTQQLAVRLQQARQVSQWQHRATQDPLTGLGNRLWLSERFPNKFQASQPIALLFVSLDRFRRVNDALGHAVGDLLIESVASRIRAVAIASDLIIRHGGDEFLIITSPDAADMLADLLLATLSNPHELAHHRLLLTASIGVAHAPADADTLPELIQCADQALCAAKQQGRNRWVRYTPALRQTAEDELTLELELREALQNNQLRVYLQPKVDQFSGQIVGAEALMRWPRAEGGWVSPAQFIAVAELSGLIVDLGAWSLRTLCQQLASWIEQGLPVVPVAINVADQEFADPQYPDRLAEVLAEWQLPPQLLELEITEATLQLDTGQQQYTLQRLRDVGVRLTLDDFGTGYSCLSHLNKLPLHSLKIDRSFIMPIRAAKEYAQMPQAVIGLARSLNLTLVAEGIETSEQAAWLAAHGCAVLQGFYYSAPLPLPEFAKWLGRPLKAGSALRPGSLPPGQSG
jgi:diguanylate cyclase (GGDEF)-like protein